MKEFEWPSSMSVRTCLGLPSACCELNRDICSGSREIIVVVMPRQDGDALAVAGGEGGYVGLIADACFEHVFEGNGGIALHAESITAHAGEHAEGIQHGLVDAVGGERAKASEVRLVLELEGPGECTFEIHAVLLGEVEFSREAGRSVAGIHGAVSIGEVVTLARGATFGSDSPMTMGVCLNQETLRPRRRPRRCH